MLRKGLGLFKNVRCPVNNNPHFKKFRETHKNNPDMMDALQDAEIAAHATTGGLLFSALAIPSAVLLIKNHEKKALEHKKAEQEKLANDKEWMTDKFDNKEVNNRPTKSF